MGVHDDPQRLASRRLPRRLTDRQQRIVGEHGADADNHGVDSATQQLGVGPGRGRGDPLAGGVRGGDPAVDRHAGLERHIGAVPAHRRQPHPVHLGRVVAQHAFDHIDPAARTAAAPPAAGGQGSATAITTLATPAAISAALHGPVRPV